MCKSEPITINQDKKHGRRLLVATLSCLVPAIIAFLPTQYSAATPACRIDDRNSVSPINVRCTQESSTPAELALLSKQAVAHLRRSRIVKGQRLRVLSITRLPPETGTAQTSRASVVVFNYSQGIATRVVMSWSNGVVLREERLRGRPQPSDEELHEAREIIRADPELARMLEAGGVIDGGFVVDAPRQASARDRFVQFQILTSDRKGLQLVVVVNLTTGRVAESRKR